MKSVSLTINGKTGIFNSKHTLSLFLGHTTNVNLKEYMKELRKLATQAVKSNDLMITVCSMDANCKRTDNKRYIYRGGWSGEFELDLRTFNGYDYSDSKKLLFTKESDLIKYMMKDLETTIRKIMGTLPEEQSYYSQILDNLEVDAEIREFVKK